MSVVEGSVLDVAVDVRFGSPTFGQHVAVELSAEDHRQLWIPAGFAHGFLALTERVQFLYKCSDFYNAQDEHGILWNDAGMGISWPVTNPLVSEKDARHPGLASVPPEFLQQYPRK